MAGAPGFWRRFAPILSVQLIGTLGYSIAVPFLVFLVTDFGGAAWTYGLVGATYSACQLVGAPVLGRWSDRIGRRPVLVLSQAGTMLAWVVFGVALLVPRTSFGAVAGAELTLPLLLVFVARALDGLTGGNVSVANAYVADVTQDEPEARPIAFGRMGMAASLGFTVGPAIAGLTAGLGYAGPVGAAVAISAVATALCFTLPTARPCPEGPPEAPAVARVLGAQQRRCDRPTPEARPGVLRRGPVPALLVATFVQFLAFNLFYAGFPVHAGQSLGWDAVRMGGFFSVVAGVMIVAQGPLLQLVSRRLAPPAVFVVGLLALTGAFAVFAVARGDGMYAGAVLFSLGNGLAWPTFQTRLAQAAAPADQGAVQGAATSAGSLASILGLVAGGILYPYVETGLFLAGAALFLLVAAGAPFWFRPGPPEAPGIPVASEA